MPSLHWLTCLFSPGNGCSLIRFLISFGSDASALQVFHLVEEEQHQAEKSEFALPHTYSTARDSLTSSAASPLNFCVLPFPFFGEHLSLPEGSVLPRACPVEPAELRAVPRVPLDKPPRARGFPLWELGALDSVQVHSYKD